MKLNKSTFIAAMLALSTLAAVAGTNKGAHPNTLGYGYYGRGSWNARAPQCALSYMSTLNRAVFHHTANSGDATVAANSSGVCPAAIVNHTYADAYSRATPVPSKYICPSWYCARRSSRSAAS